MAELDSWEPVREGWELANSVGLPFRVCGFFSFAVEMVCKVGTVGLTALLGPGESDSAGPPGPSDVMKKLQKLAEQMRRINTLVESIERNVETLLVDFHFHMDDMKSIVAHFQELQTLLVAYALSQSQEDLRLIQDYAYHADLEFAHATYSFLEPWSVQKLLEEVLRQSEASMPNAKFSSGIEAASALNWISLARVSLLNLMVASRINVTSREVAFADAGVEQLFQEAQGQLEEYQQIARRLGIGRSVRWGLSNLKALAPRCKAANTVWHRERAQIASSATEAFLQTECCGLQKAHMVWTPVFDSARQSRCFCEPTAPDPVTAVEDCALRPQEGIGGMIVRDNPGDLKSSNPQILSFGPAKHNACGTLGS